ncbi:CHAT domain-containing protein [Leptothoe sp. PORK10 BA2]|uniref:CHAT domain-containing protein n=1 Tax=Leptothoe sp. PORK10 BA2 TaxID=3110254 RepID=UPI002B1FC167|nr:CHAT domain-containing protein [Leptothoe sp. PORK10 BA2]MEA5467179.1 CHAT domain-containing protein [Leptothoe sp. PORK10 BA2]
MNLIKILILTANPTNTGAEPLGLDAEVRRIEEAFLRSHHRDCFQVVTQLATRTIDLRRALLDHRPQIVHFSGHGMGEQGLVLENDAGKIQLVGTEALAGLFGIFETGQIECVLLNACYSDVQATAIHQFVDCVIGMNQPIGDVAAVQFAEGFYDALGSDSSYDQAFKIGCSAIALEGSTEYSKPVLKYRKRPGLGGVAESASAEKPLVPESAVPPAPSAPSQSIGNVTISGNNNPFNVVQSGGDATVSQNNSRQSMTISGSTISGHVGQAGGDLNQPQYQNQGEAAKSLSPAEVVQLIMQMESLIKSAALSESQQGKAVAYLEVAKEEANSEEPDKEFAAKNLQKATKILKETNEAVDAGQSLWKKVAPLLGQLLPWLGVASHFFGL